MVVNVTPEMIQRFETERKAKLAKIQAENNRVNQYLADQKAASDAYWDKKTMQKSRTALRVEHPCEHCKGTIRKGEQYYSRSPVVNVSRLGWTPQRLTVYWHVHCPERKEAN